jgi:glutamate racemase
MAKYEGYVGAFDSGVGGISVLKAMVRELPHEKFIYFGDSAHAPYGDKPDGKVRELASNVVEHLLSEGVKAVVIACNTATSAAKETIRAAHPEVPILGVEPALKPALEANIPGDILVLATRMTLRRDSFKNLEQTYEWMSDDRIIHVPCSGLADLVETGDFDGSEMRNYLEDQLGVYRGKVGSVVLGCTHYPFVREQIRRVVGDVPFFDGGEGTARHLRHRLAENGLLAPESQEGCVEFASSKPGEQTLALYRRLYAMPL